MKICIYGAGAIGVFFGARLGAQGHTMSAVARGATLAALQSQGLRLLERDAEVRAPVTAASDSATLGVQDIVVLAVKGPALAGAATDIAPLLGAGTVVLSAMNGVPWWFFDGLPGPCAGLRLAALDRDGALAGAIAISHVIGAVVHASCTSPQPGLSRHIRGNSIIIGEPAGAPAARTTALGAALTEAGFECRVSPRIQQDIWYKLWGNMTMNPLSALTGATCDRLLDDPLVNGFIVAVMREASAIGAAIGCPIAETGEERNTVTRRLGAFRTSMLQDVEQGKPLEIDVLLTAVREIAAQVRVATPNLDALLGLTRVFAQTRGLYRAS